MHVRLAAWRQARVLVGQEPKGYNEVDSLDEAIALADSRSRTIPTPRSYDEWAELLELLTVDNEKPARPQAVDALHRALDAMESKPVAFIDAIGQWIARRLAGGGGTPSSHVTLKVLKVIISLLDGVVQDEDEAGVQTGVARYCVSMPSIFSSAESASDLTGSLTGSAGRVGGSGSSVGEAFAVAIRAHCTELLQELAELDVAPDPQWGERPMQMYVLRLCVLRRYSRDQDALWSPCVGACLHASRVLRAIQDTGGGARRDDSCTRSAQGLWSGVLQREADKGTSGRAGRVGIS